MENIAFLLTGAQNLPVELLMNQIYRPQDAKAILKTLDYGDMLLKEVPMYSMGCNISKEAAQMAYDAMKNE